MPICIFMEAGSHVSMQAAAAALAAVNDVNKRQCGLEGGCFPPGSPPLWGENSPKPFAGISTIAAYLPRFA